MRLRIALSFAVLLVGLTPVSVFAAQDVIYATTSKNEVGLRKASSLSAPVIARLNEGSKVAIDRRMGIWYQATTHQQKQGYLRVDEVSFASLGKTSFGASLGAFLGHQPDTRSVIAGGVRGLDESQLKAASFDAKQLKKLEGYRVTAAQARQHAKANGWKAVNITWAEEDEAGRHASNKVHKALGKVHGLLGKFGLGDKHADEVELAKTVLPESEKEKEAEELALGPQLAGRVLGAAHLWNNAKAQKRVNLVGKWLALQTSRPNLPWTFGIIDAPEYNAFAAPGGYILVTRGLYQLVQSDDELAAVLAHEIAHVVQRDHYHVIRKQELMAEAGKQLSKHIETGSSQASQLARAYVEKHGATVLMTGLDRNAEYRADRIGEVYLARSAIDPLVLYSVLQTMQVAGSSTGGLVQLYKTHPTIQKRLDRLQDGELDKLYRLIGQR